MGLTHPARRLSPTIWLVAVLGLSGCAGQVRELMPAPVPHYQAAPIRTLDQVPASRRVPRVDLLYITDRAPLPPGDSRLPYGQSRSRSVAFGSAVVELRPDSDWPALAQRSLSVRRKPPIALDLGQVTELGRYPLEPYPVRRVGGLLERDPAALRAHREAEAQLRAEVERRLAEAPTDEVMLYIHGFNETFASAAHTAAELCHFLGRVHVCAFYTWPAAYTGNPLLSYISTTESAKYSIGHLKRTLRTLAKVPGVKGLQLLAHSRGTALLLDALRELALEAIVAGRQPAEMLRLENVVLLSPDVDGEVASQELELFASDPEITTAWKGPGIPRVVRQRLTVYSSPEDRALHLSKILFRSRARVGELTAEDFSPAAEDYFSTLGVLDLVVYKGKRTDFFGHGYFTTNPEVSADLIELIRNGAPPDDPRRGLVRTSKITWTFPSTQTARDARPSP